MKTVRTMWPIMGIHLGKSTRTFLQDGDLVALRGACTREGYRRIGFGGCVATVLPMQGTSTSEPT